MPWLGYFYKIYASDVFVFHDIVDFSKASYTKRCKIRRDKASSQTTWLSVPVRRHKAGLPISDILMVEKRDWILSHLHKIENTYSGARCFRDHYDWIRETMLRAQLETTLSGCNMLLIRELADKLSMRAKFYRSSEMQITGNGSELNLEIARSIGATTYLAGKGSENYQDDDAFVKAGIGTITHDIGAWLNKNPYDQGTGLFTGGLSIVDALMHIGVDGILSMFREFQQSMQ